MAVCVNLKVFVWMCFVKWVCADVGGCALAWIEISRLIKLRSGAPTDNSFAQMIARGERKREREG